MSLIEGWELEEELVDKPRTTIGKKEVLRITSYSNTVFWEMWFLTIHPFVGISVFIAKLSERWDCWRVFEDSNSQEYIQIFDIHRSLFMRLHLSNGGSKYPFQQNSSLFAEHVHRRSRVDNKFSFLKLKIWCKQAPTFRRWEECCFVFLHYFSKALLVSFHAASLSPCSCHSVSS